jgi:hypothetical protein
MTVAGRATHRAAIKGLWCLTATPNETKEMVKTPKPATTVKPIAAKSAILYRKKTNRHEPTLPRGVSLETASGSMLCRWERKLSQQETWNFVNEEWSSITNRMSISNRY